MKFFYKHYVKVYFWHLHYLHYLASVLSCKRILFYMPLAVSIQLSSSFKKSLWEGTTITTSMTEEKACTRNVASGRRGESLDQIHRTRRRRLCRPKTPPKVLRRVLKKRVRCGMDTRGRAEAYNCRRTELNSKAAARYKNATGCYYSYIQVACRHLKGPRCFSREAAIFGRFVCGKR